MGTIETTLAQAYHDRKFDGDTCNYISNLLRAPASAFSVEARCQMLGLLRSIILTTETYYNGYAYLSRGIPDIDTRYAPLLTNVFNLQARTRFSNDLTGDMTRNMQILVRMLKNDDRIQKDLSRWPMMKLADRFNLLCYIKDRHRTVYGLNPFSISKAHLRANIDGDSVATLRPPRYRTDIRINRKVLEQPEPDRALEVLHHESTHIEMVQLARAWGNNKTRSADGELAYYRTVYGAHYPPAVGPAYANDSGEIIATYQGRAFARKMKLV